MIPIDNKGKVECDEAKLRFSCQSNSDHIANIFALKGYQDALRKNGESGIFGYCRRNYLSHSTMRMIHGMKMQTIDQFKQLGLLNSNAEAWKHANRYATNTDVLKTVLAFGYTQTCCAVSQHIKIFKVAATASVESRKVPFHS